jgi:hypothetical protein
VIEFSTLLNVSVVCSFTGIVVEVLRTSWKLLEVLGAAGVSVTLLPERERIVSMRALPKIDVLTVASNSRRGVVKELIRITDVLLCIEKLLVPLPSVMKSIFPVAMPLNRRMVLYEWDYIFSIPITQGRRMYDGDFHIRNVACA